MTYISAEKVLGIIIMIATIIAFTRQDMDVRKGKPEKVPTVLWNIGDALVPKMTREFLDTPVATIYYTDINLWSFVHLLTGAALAAYDISPLKANVIHFTWEMYQLAIGMSKLPGDNLDIILDTMFFNIGYWSTYMIKASL